MVNWKQLFKTSELFKIDRVRSIINFKLKWNKNYTS